MKSQEKLTSDLDKLISVISKVDGVVAVILFGSVAKGEHDEYSDYDLLIVFRDDSIMWRNWNYLFEEIGKLRLQVHAIPNSIRELEQDTEPVFRDDVLSHGRLVYLKHPFQAPAYLMGLQPTAVITYSLSHLKQKDKMKIVYALYGKKTSSAKTVGMVEEVGGIKLADGCLMVPYENSRRVLEALNRMHASPRLLKVYAASHEKS